MITRTLVAEGILPERFSFTPFPIRTPELLSRYIDPEITCFVTINDDWSSQEIGILEELGHPVEVLWERRKDIEATSIRALLLAGDDSWREMVPSSVASYLEELDLEQRLRKLQG